MPTRIARAMKRQRRAPLLRHDLNAALRATPLHAYARHHRKRVTRARILAWCLILLPRNTAARYQPLRTIL